MTEARYREEITGRIDALTRWHQEAARLSGVDVGPVLTVRDGWVQQLGSVPQAGGWVGRYVYWSAYAEECRSWLAWCREHCASLEDTAAQAVETADRVAERARYQMGDQ